MKLSPDLQSLACVLISNDNNVCILDSNTGLLKKQLRGHKSCIQDVCYSPKGDLVASCCGSNDPTFSNDCSVRIWNLLTDKPFVLDGHQGTVCSVSFSPDGTMLASGGYDRAVRIWDVQTGTAIGKPLQWHKNAI